ncbi:cytochrome P450 3A40-like [Anguilla rostrata]|uniref:cytochrome P450 3A40-like n=1 Tax=Anguilla rostrata TaxID=7938 RepID=UPI0030D2BD18
MTMIYFPPFSAETLALLITFICLLIVYGYWPYGVFKKLGIPGPKPSPFFGSVFEYDKGLHQMDMRCFKTYGRLWGVYEGRLPLLCTVDTRMIKTVLVKECFSYFINRRDFSFNGPFDDAVSNARGEDWKQKRSLLSPLFSSGRIKEMLPLMKQHSDKLVQCLQEVANRDEAVEVREYFGAYCLDAIANVALSIDTESLSKPNDPSVVKIKKAFTLNVDNPVFLFSVLFPFLNPLLEKAGFCIFPLAELRFLISVVEKVKLDREKNVQKNRMDFLQLMIELQLAETKHGTNGNKKIKGLTHREILSSAAIFLAAGFETASKSLAFLAYNLATNPGVMKRLQDEIDKVFPNKAPVMYEQLVQMEYLDMVLNESLRLYPIALRLERLCTETIVVNGVTIPKDTLVTIPVFALHRDPELWPEPECFNPERFSKENKDSMDPYAFLPFGAGPRNCIGMRFAVALMKLAIVQVLQNFSFVTCKETEIPLQLDKLPLLGTINPIKMKVVSRGPTMKEE